MPFGSFDAVIQPKQPKQPKVKKPKKEKKPKAAVSLPKPPVQPTPPAPPAPPVPPVLPTPPAPPAPPVQIQAPPVAAVVHGNIMQIQILVVGRTVSEAEDFVAGMYEDINPAIEQNGISLYSEDNRVSTALLDRKKRLEALCRSDKPIYAPANEDQTPKTYTLMLSRSGIQNFSIRLTMHCTAASAAGSAPPCNCVWVLADAPVYEDSADSYAAAATGILNAAANAGSHTVLVMSQFEKYGKIRNRDHLCSIESDVYRRLSAKLKESIAPSADVPIIPVQVYGGLAFDRTDGSGAPILGENRFGGLASYKPEGCHIPLLYAIEQVNSGSSLNDNLIISTVKKLNKAQTVEFSRYGVNLGG